MDPDHYKVEVIHFINPYLIWVEVPDSGSKDQDDFYFEQIGIYGVLPLEMIMDPEEDTLVTRRSADWMPAATVLMKNLLADAKEVSFCPLHIDHRNSIFDDNIHKYGEIIIKKPNGKYRLLSKLLTKSGFAISNESQFLDELHSGKIKTQLTHHKIKDIIHQLERKCKKQVTKQTTVFQTAQKIESALTVKNLEAHNRLTKTCGLVDRNRAEELIQRKLEDLKMCKEVDYEPVGRASTRKHREATNTTSMLQKKLKLLKLSRAEEKGRDSVVKYFEKQRDNDLNTLNRPKSDVSTPDGTQPIIMDIQKSNKASDVSNVRNVTNKLTVEEYDAGFEETKYEETRQEKKLKGVEIKKIKQRKFSGSDSYKEEEVHSKKNQGREISTEPQECDTPNDVVVKYGPPDANIQKLAQTLVTQEEFSKTFARELKEEKQEDETIKKEKEDLFAKVDSDVDVIDIPAEIQKTKHIVKTQDSAKMDVQSSNTLKNPVSVTDGSTVVKKSPAPSVLYELLTSNKDKETTSDCTTKKDPCLQLKRKLRMHKEYLSRKLNSSTSDTSNKDSSTSVDEDFKKTNKDRSKTVDSDDETVSEVIDKINSEYQPITSPRAGDITASSRLKNNVNPFKNVDPSISVFVDKLVTPVLMVHSKIDKRFQPTFKLRDVPFTSHIQIKLKNMSVEQPMMLQTITWPAILRGYSVFMVSPKKSGKTMGYLPAVCRLVSDNDTGIDSVGPMCVVVCATAHSVSEIERLANKFLGSKQKVLGLYSGMNELDITTCLLNGCDMLVCTPSILVRLLQTDFGVDLRRLATFVLDDCERLFEVYMNEIKFFLFKIKEMLKLRVVKELKVQYVLASRVWCDFMEPLAKKAPDTVVCIGAFQECVLYSKASTTASFVTKKHKLDSVLEFLKQIDTSKRTVIVCRTDDEVEMLEKALKDAKYVVFACNSAMNVFDLYSLRGTWDEYHEPIIGPILVCLDGNLTHLNITNAHYLVHYSMPHLFSVFCKRFSVLNDNYASIFKETNEDVKIKILLEDHNVEQLPKILHFIKRCSSEVPSVLDDICEKVLEEKDVLKAKKLVPICDNLMTLGECPDFWNCQERHAFLKDYDQSKHWVPKEGVITFKISHYHSAVWYSARLLSTTTQTETVKYPQNYNMLKMKISMYYGRESNRKLHGIPEVGDICAVSKGQKFYRCQVVKILSYYPKGNPNYVLIRLIDKEMLEKAQDIDLYYLPEDLKKTEIHVVHVRLANIKPKDKDITFSNLATEQLRSITDNDDDLYLRGQICLTVGNCVFVDSLETCRDLSTMHKTVVRHDFKQELLERHGVPNPEHIKKIEELCVDSGSIVKKEPERIQTVQVQKKLPKGQWAHFEKDDLSAVLFASAEHPGSFFVRLVKFEDSCRTLINDIQIYIAEKTEKLTNICQGDIVLAKLPDDGMYERARIDDVKDEKVNCFFVDQGDWREVPKHHLASITEKIINQLPFQAIECRLVGVRPPGEHWSEFATNWFTNCFEDNTGDFKQIYAKYFTKEKALYTGGHKYGVALIDTNSDQDVIINDLIVEVNLGQEEETELEFLNQLDFKRKSNIIKEDKCDDTDKWEEVSKTLSSFENYELQRAPLDLIFPKQPIRSVPLVDSDNESFDEKWNINVDEDLMAMLSPAAAAQSQKMNTPPLPALKQSDSKSVSEVSSLKRDSSNSKIDSVVGKSSVSDMHIVTTSRIKELDSDDYTSPELSQVSAQPTTEQPHKQESVAAKLNPAEPLRKPKLTWWQKKKTVSIKIQLIGVEKYDLEIADRRINFSASVNDTQYGFNLELYGIVDHKNAMHSNKGQYILVNLVKLLERNWLTLTKNGGIQKWISYDVDSIDVSSDEEEVSNLAADVIKNMCVDDSETEEEEFMDDLKYRYNT